MERKLEAYRAKRKREENINKFKNDLNSFYDKYFKTKPKEKMEDEVLITQKPEENLEIEDDISSETSSEVDDSMNCLTRTDVLYYLLWFVLWVTVYAIFIELEFGMVYLLFSCLLGIYLNTRTGIKHRNEISAYSVFNKNCESIDGALKAEQFEREIRYGAGSVH